MNTDQIKILLKSRGWSMVDVAARWGYSVGYMSRVVNDRSRPPHLNDAFAGLPQRATTEVVREKRHIRVPKAKVVFAMFPVGRIVEADDNRYLEEGCRAVVVANTGMMVKDHDISTIALLPYGTGDVFELTMDEVAHSFCDLGIDDPNYHLAPG